MGINVWISVETIQITSMIEQIIHQIWIHKGDHWLSNGVDLRRGPKIFHTLGPCP